MKKLAGSRLLCVLPQNPFDPCSGAARSVRTICELLAKNGVTVHCLFFRTTESHHFTDVRDEFRGVLYTPIYRDGSLDVFTQTYRGELDLFNPDIVFGFGGTPWDSERWNWAARCGYRVVFALRNHGYLDGGAGFFSPFSGILTPSRYLANVYSASLGVQSTPIPPLIDLEDIIPDDPPKPEDFTVINAGAPEKGRRFMERLGPELVKRGIPLLLVEGRGGRFDCPGAVWMDPVAQPKEIYAKTKVLLVPSLWQEPAGRVVAEAALNGIPSIVSNRGGLSEMGPTFTMGISSHITESYQGEIGVSDIMFWVEFIEDLNGCPGLYEGRAAHLGKQFHPDVLGPRYLEYFQGILNGDVLAS